MKAFYQRRMGFIPKDPVLSKYPFCNNYRFLDYGSQCYLMAIEKSEDKILGGILFDLFKKQETFEIIYNTLSQVITWDNFGKNLSNLINTLTLEKKRGSVIYTNAYIIPSINKISSNKAEGWLINIHNNKENLKELNKVNTLEESFNVFKSIDGFGDFLAMQFAIDLSWVDEVKYDGYDDFVIPGNGAVRGLEKLGIKKSEMSEFLLYLTENQFALFKNICFYSNVKLCPMDFQNTFCEFDKYTRSGDCPTNLKFNNGGRNRMKRKITKSRIAPKIIIVPNKLKKYAVN
jgi:hypothetical protein